MTTNVLKGSCLCGGIAYEIHAPLNDVINCHCSMCRKAHGAAFRTRASVKVSDFKFLFGEELLTFYESSPGERRSFCSVCGAVLITKFDKYPDTYGFALGTLDTDPEAEITRHIFTKYKAPWYKITDDTPQVEDVTDEVLQNVKNE
ncbi:MAG: hypothetical protein ACI9XC_002649 [Gammaproteobacteria bacterium]|jgi:hypothetical protein